MRDWRVRGSLPLRESSQRRRDRDGRGSQKAAARDVPGKQLSMDASRRREVRLDLLHGVVDLRIERRRLRTNPLNPEVGEPRVEVCDDQSEPFHRSPARKPRPLGRGGSAVSALLFLLDVLGLRP